MRGLSTFALASLLAISRPVVANEGSADPAEVPCPTEAEPPSRSPLAAVAAVVPGIALHGAGHYVAGHPKIAERLLLAEALGVALILGGALTLLESGNSRNLAGAANGAIVIGSGIFAGSFAVDVYGTIATDGGAVDMIPRAPPLLENELGYRHVADPRFSYDHFVVEKLTLRVGPFRLTPSAWFATGAENVRYRVEAAYRFLGLQPGDEGREGGYLDVVIAGVRHDFRTENFRRTGGEIQLDWRYDFARLGETMRGAFADLSLGYGYATIDYTAPGLNIPADGDDVLLAAVGLGVVLRGPAAPGSEVRVYYDHRHDEFAAGLITPGKISGDFGRFGVDLRWFFTPRLGVLVQGEASSAIVAGASVLVREGKLQARGAVP